MQKKYYLIIVLGISSFSYGMRLAEEMEADKREAEIRKTTERINRELHAAAHNEMDKKVNYIVYQKLNHGVPVTKIDFFLPCKEPDKPEIVIKTIYLDENKTKAFMQLVGEAKEREAWRAWNAKWNAARL